MIAQNDCTCLETTLLGVDDDATFTDTELPKEFASLRLDTDDTIASAAATVLQHIDHTLLDALWQLELAERALRISENCSRRAKHARVQLRRALAGFELGVVSGVDAARQALLNPGADKQGAEIT